jgi:hypothetical protein
MTVPYIDALLVRQSDNSFHSEAVRLPSARLGNVFRLSGERLDFREADGGVLAECGDERIVGRVELTDSLVAASEVQKARIQWNARELSATSARGEGPCGSRSALRSSRQLPRLVSP